jgi:hypothetical protein
VRRDYDSLLGVFYIPTNTFFTNLAVANNQVVTQTFSRVVSRPDLVFSAQDLVSPATQFPIVDFIVARTDESRFNTNGLGIGTQGRLAGPGIITPPIFVIFNKAGQLLFNEGPNFIDEGTANPDWRWGSFDGTTNEPVIFPSGTSIRNLENQVLLHVSPSTLRNGLVGQSDYTETLSASGGQPYFQPPFTWSIVSPVTSGGSPTLLQVSSNGVITSVGSFPRAGTFPVVIRLTDSQGHTADQLFSFTVIP